MNTITLESLLRVQRLQRLQVGDTLELGALSNVTLRVGGRPTLLAEPGEADGLRSVRVCKRLVAS